MTRPQAVTFKGTPLSLAGEEVRVGQAAPDFQVHYFDGGLKAIRLADLRGKPAIISVVPSLDTSVCQVQTKRFNNESQCVRGQGPCVDRQSGSAVRDEPVLRRRGNQESEGWQ